MIKGANMQILIFIVYIAVGVLQIAAYLEGMEVWFGIGTVLALVLAIIGWSLPFGSIAISAIAFYGARYGWHWESWKAILLAAPGVIFGILVATTGGIVALVGAARGGATKGAPSLPHNP